MITIRNEKVKKFYEKHGELDCETMNILLVNFLESIFENTSAKVDNNAMLSFMRSLEGKVDALHKNHETTSQTILNLQTSVLEFPNQVNSNISSQMVTLKQMYVQELEASLTNKQAEGQIEMLEKVRLLFDDKVCVKVQEQLKRFDESIRGEIEIILKHGKVEEKEAMMECFTNSIQQRCDSLQQFMMDCQSKTQEHITKQDPSEALGHITTYFDRQKKSSFRGVDGEKKLEWVLAELYPSGIIKNTTGEAKSGDFVMDRAGYPRLLIENKDYSNNVPTAEVEKFIRDVDETDCKGGVFLSQSTGISKKQDMQIDMHNGKIMVFLHNVMYNEEKIRMGVNMVDHLIEVLDDVMGEDEHEAVSAAVLTEINEEYQQYMTERNNTQEMIRKFQKDLTKKMDNMELPSLKRLLATRFASAKEEKKHKCPICEGNVYFKSKAALSAHMKKHKNKSEAQKEDQIKVEIS